MKILFVSDTYYPHLNGVYYFVCRMGPLLQQKGHEVAVIAPSETIHSSSRKIDNIDVYGVPSLPVLIYPKVRFPIPVLIRSQVSKIIQNFQPDIIHIQDHFTISQAVIKVAKSAGIPVIATNHFMPENLTALVRSEKWKKKLEKWLWSQFSEVLNKVIVVTTPTETGARLIRPKLNVKVIAISSGIDLKEFNPLGDTRDIRLKYNIPDKPVFLFVGRLDPEKNIEELLQAVAVVAKQIDFCFVIVGKGLRKKVLEQLAEELGISGNVIFTGFVPEEDLPFIYKLSRCFVIASIAELLSLATLQAMASGLPVIAANAGALPELVKHKMNGYLFNTNDIEKLSQSMCEILTKDDICFSMSEKSLQRAAQHDINNTVESFETLYKLHATKPLLKPVLLNT